MKIVILIDFLHIKLMLYPNTPHIGACVFTQYKRRGAPLPDNRRMRLYSDNITFCDDYALLSLTF